MRPRPPLPAVSLALCALVALAACGTVDANATSGPDVDGGAIADGGGGPIRGDGGFCEGSGPTIPLPDGTCTGDVGKRTFLFAVCACTDLRVSGTFKTDSLDSSRGKTTGAGASIGANGALATQSDLDVQGAAYVAGAGVSSGTPAATFVQRGAIAGDLRVGGGVRADAPFTVGRDVYAAGDVTAAALTCAGTLHVPAQATVTGVTAASTVREPVAVGAPCDCAKPLDIAATVAAFASTNDDAIAGLTPSSLASGTNVRTLPCGRYYVDRIGGDALTLHLTGRTALFVAGDIALQGALTIDVSPGAELDLFVAGGLTLPSDATIGDPAAPARARVYVGGSSVTLAGNAKIAANLYAPRADVAISSNFEMAGALFVGNLAFSGNFTLHYDEAVLATEGCQPTAHGCATCHDCAGAAPACKGGTCAPCSTDADCCAPLRCDAGACIADVK